MTMIGLVISKSLVAFRSANGPFAERKATVVLLFLAAMLACCPLLAADKLAAASKSRAAKKLSATIDARINARLQAEQVEAAPQADDAEFLRRVWLHLAGTIPPVAEVRQFLADEAPDKRERLVDELLERPSYVRNFTTFWRRAWLPEADADAIAQSRAPALENWLRQQLLQDQPYDELVRSLLTAPIPKSGAASVAQMNDAENGPLAFFLAKDGKPESLAASASRAFLGVRLDCAQCHDHPFDSWRRDQFWSFAAFFAGLERGDPNQPSQTALLREFPDRHDLAVPETGRIVTAAFLDGSQPRWRSRGGRHVLADWITSPKNPFFARAVVNRLWGHLFGMGIVDPVDDFSPANPPSHPELLEELSAAFVAQDYDIKFLLRAILGSQAYQRTSRQSRGDLPAQLFDHMPVQGLLAEQLLRSLSPILGAELPTAVMNAPFAAAAPEELSVLFSRPGESPTQRQTTILQALALMNGRTMAEALDFENGSLLAVVVDFPALSTAERIEMLFLGTLSRPPTAEEALQFQAHIERARDANEAYGDLLWALINSAEFGCNH
jgi:hypothetical protein